MERARVAAAADVQTARTAGKRVTLRSGCPCAQATSDSQHVSAPIRSAASSGTCRIHHALQDPRQAYCFQVVCPSMCLSDCLESHRRLVARTVEDHSEAVPQARHRYYRRRTQYHGGTQAGDPTRVGLRIAFLGYVFHLLPQYWATDNRVPGSTDALRHLFMSRTSFSPARTARVCDGCRTSKDLKYLCQDSKAAKQNSDVLFVSLHWACICDKPSSLISNRRCGTRQSMPAASVILRSHPAPARGVEVYNGGVVFIHSSEIFLFPPRTLGVSYGAQPQS